MPYGLEDYLCEMGSPETGRTLLLCWKNLIKTKKRTYRFRCALSICNSLSSDLGHATRATRPLRFSEV